MKRFSLPLMAAALLAIFFGCDGGSTSTPAGDSDISQDTSTDGTDVSVDGTSDGIVDGTINPDGGEDVSVDGLDSSSDVSDSTDSVDGTDVPPEPGSVEFWKLYVPGTWDMTPCTSTEGKDCILELEILPTASVEDGSIACPDSEYMMHTMGDGTIAGFAYSCLEHDSIVTMCKNTADVCGTSISGSLVEKIVTTGTCSDGKSDSARKCSRQSDCSDLQGASCAGLKAEFWLNIDYTFFGETEVHSRAYLKR